VLAGLGRILKSPRFARLRGLEHTVVRDLEQIV
jgi:hypothetical protein